MTDLCCVRFSRCSVVTYPVEKQEKNMFASSLDSSVMRCRTKITHRMF